MTDARTRNELRGRRLVMRRRRTGTPTIEADQIRAARGGTAAARRHPRPRNRQQHQDRRKPKQTNNLIASTRASSPSAQHAADVREDHHDEHRRDVFDGPEARPGSLIAAPKFARISTILGLTTRYKSRPSNNWTSSADTSIKPQRSILLAPDAPELSRIVMIGRADARNQRDPANPGVQSQNGRVNAKNVTTIARSMCTATAQCVLGQ